MTPSAFRFRVTGGGTYDVIRREDSAYLGRVVRSRERYRAPLHAHATTVTVWRAYPGDNPHRPLKDGGGQLAARFDTRKDAALALLPKTR